MTRTQNLKYKMYAAILEVLQKYPDAVAAVPKLAELLPQLIAQVGVVDDGTQLDSENTKGETRKKGALRDRLAANCYRLANAVALQASIDDDETLQAKIPTAMSTFQFGRDAELLGLFKTVAKAAGPIIKGLEAVGIEATLLPLIEADIAEFRANITSPKVKRNDNTLKRATWAGDFKKTDQLLLKIDLVVNSLNGKAGMEELVASYKKGRILGITNGKKGKQAMTEIQPELLGSTVSANGNDQAPPQNQQEGNAN